MDPQKQKSAFVALVMTDANEAEIQEATRNWLEFLQTVHRIFHRLADEVAKETTMEDADANTV